MLRVPIISIIILSPHIARSNQMKIYLREEVYGVKHTSISEF